MTSGRSKVVALRPGSTTIEDAAERFLAERDLAPGTKRIYRLSLAALAADLGGDSPLGQVTTDALRHHLAARYHDASPATFNRNLATLQSFASWAHARRLVAENPATGLERRKERRTKRQATVQRAIDLRDLDRFWGDRNTPLRLKAFTRMLYETGARASEVLGLDIEDLDLVERSASITGKGGHAEHIYWATGTARLLPRVLDGRVHGPVFLTDRASVQAVAKGDLDMASGRGRLSYRRAAEEFTAATGWTLHQLRHSRLTHLAENGVDVALLKAKSRHRSLRSLERYVRPSEASVAKLTADHDPFRRRP